MYCHGDPDLAGARKVTCSGCSLHLHPELPHSLAVGDDPGVVDAYLWHPAAELAPANLFSTGLACPLRQRPISIHGWHTVQLLQCVLPGTQLCRPAGLWWTLLGFCPPGEF